MSEQQQRDDEIGALWSKNGQKGEYMTGYVMVNGERLPVVCFRVQRGGERAPTWRILKSKPREQAAPAPEPVGADDMGW